MSSYNFYKVKTPTELIGGTEILRDTDNYAYARVCRAEDWNKEIGVKRTYEYEYINTFKALNDMFGKEAVCYTYGPGMSKATFADGSQVFFEEEKLESYKETVQDEAYFYYSESIDDEHYDEYIDNYTDRLLDTNDIISLIRDFRARDYSSGNKAEILMDALIATLEGWKIVCIYD